jgi:hypothetical protein
MAVMKPQEIEDEEHEQVLERVAAIDVAKASGMVCTRVPHPGRPGRRRTLAWTVPATTNAVLELAETLVGEGIEKVTLESTADYWRIWFYLLEAAGLDVQLVRAVDVKQAPGRPKTDPLTELPGPVPWYWRTGGAMALMVADRDGYGGCAAGFVAAGGAAGGLAGGDGGSFRAVPAG